MLTKPRWLPPNEVMNKSNRVDSNEETCIKDINRMRREVHHGAKSGFGI